MDDVSNADFARDAANALRRVAGARRARNGRLALDRFDRRAKPRWKLLRLNGQWYGRERLRGTVARRAVVPHSARPLTPDELSKITDPTPWSLDPRRKWPI